MCSLASCVVALLFGKVTVCWPPGNTSLAIPRRHWRGLPHQTQMDKHCIFPAYQIRVNEDTLYLAQELPGSSLGSRTPPL